MAKAGGASSLGVAGRQRQLSVKERQFVAAIRREAAAAERDAPGVIHAVRFSCTAKTLDAEIVFDRDRDRGGHGRKGTLGEMQTGAKADKPESPSRSSPRSKPTGKPAVQQCGDSRNGQGATEQKCPPAARHSPPLPPVAAPDEEISKEEAVAVRDLIAHKVSEAVHALGGDSETGHELLCDKQPFTLGSHKTRGVRLLKDSMAANWSAEKFNQTVEKIYGKVRGESRSGNIWLTHMMALDKLLKPPARTTDMDVDDAPMARPSGRDRYSFVPYADRVDHDLDASDASPSTAVASTSTGTYRYGRGLGA